MNLSGLKQLPARIDDKIARYPHRHLIGLLLVCAVFLAFGLHHLGQFMTVDEEKWLHVRVRQLYTALVNLDWRGTYINDKPGVLPALLAGIVENVTSVKRYNPTNVEHFLFLWRLPIVLFNLSLIPIIYRGAAKLIGRDEALIFAGLIACNPTVIGMSQIVNPDATLWSTSAVSVISFLLFLKKGRFRYVLGAGGFLALALISKFSANYFVLAFFCVLYLAYLSGWLPQSRFAAAALGWLATVLIGILGYYVLFPATWTRFDLFWKGTLGCALIEPIVRPFAITVVALSGEAVLLKGRISRLAIRYVGGRMYVVFGVALLTLITAVVVGNLVSEHFWQSLSKGYRGGGDPGQNLLANTIVFSSTLNSATMLALLAFSARAAISILKPLPPLQANHRRHLMMFLALGMGYLLGTSVTGFYTPVRYQVVAYPMYIAAAAISLATLFRRRCVLFLFVMAISVMELLHVSPFFLSYSNPLNFRDAVLADGWGQGGYEVAEWVNPRYCDKDTKIWYDREGFVQFSECKAYRWTKPPWDIRGLDYLVLTNRGKQWAESARYRQEGRYIYGPLLEYYSAPAEFEVALGGNPNNWVRLVRYNRSELKRVARMRANRAENGLGYLEMASPQAISFWVKTRSASPEVPFSVEGGSRRALAFDVQKVRGGIAYRLVVDNGEQLGALTTGPVNDGAWHLVVWSQTGGRKGDEYALFFDGEKVGAGVLPAGREGRPVVRQEAFTGEMDEFEIHREALTLAEVEALYTRGIEERSDTDGKNGEADE